MAGPVFERASGLAWLGTAVAPPRLMHPWDSDWHMGWMMIWWFALPLLLAVAWIVFRTRTGSDGSVESPEQALKRRYAKGEIDREAYLRTLADLRGQ